jgi:ubiquinone biosynthesis protein
MAEHEVVRVTEQELGVPWEDVFESIDPTPIAAGTIAQVHRATLNESSSRRSGQLLVGKSSRISPS